THLHPCPELGVYVDGRPIFYHLSCTRFPVGENASWYFFYQRWGALFSKNCRNATFSGCPVPSFRTVALQKPLWRVAGKFFEIMNEMGLVGISTSVGNLGQGATFRF